MKIWLVFGLLLTSCTKKKYEITNMVPEKVDVTDFIISGNYKPDSCNGKLIRLIKVKPLKLDKLTEPKLKANLEKWLIKNSADPHQIKLTDLHKRTHYLHSYFITNKPVDVYYTDIDKKTKLYIRLEKDGQFISDYKESSWVTSICDD